MPANDSGNTVSHAGTIVAVLIRWGASHPKFQNFKISENPTFSRKSLPLRPRRRRISGFGAFSCFVWECGGTWEVTKSSRSKFSLVDVRKRLGKRCFSRITTGEALIRWGASILKFDDFVKSKHFQWKIDRALCKIGPGENLRLERTFCNATDNICGKLAVFSSWNLSCTFAYQNTLSLPSTSVFNGLSAIAYSTANYQILVD